MAGTTEQEWKEFFGEDYRCVTTFLALPPEETIPVVMKLAAEVGDALDYAVKKVSLDK